MVTCPNCGAQYDVPAKFCSKCGTPIPEAPAAETVHAAAAVSEAPAPEAPQPAQGYTAPPAPPAPAGGKNKKVGIIATVAAVAVVAVIAVVLLVSGVFKSPAARFVDIHNTSMLAPAAEAVTKYSEIISKPSTANVDISTDMTLTADVRMNDEYGYDSEMIAFLRNFALQLSVDAKSGKSSVIAVNALYDDEQIFGGTITADEDGIGFYAPEVDDHYYTMSMDTIRELIDDETGLDPSTSEDIKSAIDGKKLAKVLGDIYDIAFDCATKDNVTKEKRDVELYSVGEEVNCTVYTFEPGRKDLEKMLLALADYLDKSDDAYDVYVSLYSVMNINYLSYYDSWEDECLDTYDSFIDDLRDSASDIARSIADSNFTWTTAVDGKRIYLDCISFDDYGDEVSIRYESFGEGKKGRTDAFYVEDGYTTNSIISDYTLNGNELDGSFTVNADYDSYTVDFDIDLSEKSVLGIPYGSYTLSNYVERFLKLSVGKADNGGSDHELTVYPDGSGGDRIIFTLNTTDKKATLAKAPKEKATEITDIYDLDDIFYDIANGISEKFYDSIYY